MAAVQFIPPYSDEVEFDDILPNVGLSLPAVGQQQFYLSYAEGLSAPRTDNLYAVRRQAEWQHRPPDAGIGDHQVLRPRLAPQSSDATSPRWRSTTSTTPTASCRRSIPTLGFSVDRNVGDVKVEGVDVQIGHRFGELFDAHRLGVLQRQ